MKKSSKWLSLVLAIALVSSLSACSKTGTTDPTPTAQPPETAQGGSLTLVSAAPLSNVLGFPIAGGFVEQFSASPAIETLGRYNELGDIVGWLAKEINADPIGLKVVLKLQEGIKFHDGTDFNAQAVCDVWQIYMDNGYANKFGNIESFSAIGEYEVTVELASWAYDTVDRICIEAGFMFSPSVFKEIGLEAMYTKIVGTGPFVMDSYNVGDTINYTRSENYWIEGQPYLDDVTILMANDTVTATNILKSGDAQIMLNLDAKTYSELTQTGFERFGLDTCISPTLYGVFFASGNEDDPMSNILVRKAFCHAIDTVSLNKALTYGTGTITNQLAVVGTKEYNDKVIGYPYNADKAKDLLAEAGYAPGECTITLTYQAAFSDLYVAIQGYLEAAGFKVELDIVDNTVYADRIVVGRNAPFTSTAMWFAPTKMQNWNRYFSSAPSTMVVNCIDLEEAGVIECYDKIMFSTDPAEQEAAAMELQRLIVDEYCLFFPLHTIQNLIAGEAPVKDSGINESYISTWTPETAKITK